MNGPSRQRFAQLRVPPAIGGMALAAMLLTGSAVQQGAASPALFCAPATANFGNVADELEQERITLAESGGSCQVLPSAPRSVLGSADATANRLERSNVYAQMMDLAVQQTAAGDDNVWMSVYRSLAYDRVQ